MSGRFTRRAKWLFFHVCSIRNSGKKGIASSHVTVHPFNGPRRSVTVCIPYYVAVAAAELKKIANVSNVAVLVGAVRGRIRSFGSCASMCI